MANSNTARRWRFEIVIRRPNIVFAFALAVFCGLGPVQMRAAEPVVNHRNPAMAKTKVITWCGTGDAPRWSDGRNWQGGKVPGRSDIVHFDRTSGDAFVDASFVGVIAGISLEPGYTGTLRLERDLAVHGGLVLKGGTLEQGNSRLIVSTWYQSGGVFIGGRAPLSIASGARVTGGLLTTPMASMRVETMEIRAHGVVRLGVGGKLEFTGDGAPLFGDGLLDTASNRPNSVEYTGRATSDITSASPARALRNLGRSRPTHTTTQHRRIGAAVSPRGWDGPMRSFGTAGSGLTLKQGDDNLNCAVFDSLHKFAYFGTGTSPGYIIKVDLETFTRVGVLTLNSGENNLVSAIIDPAQGYAYFGTNTSPGNVVKVALATFTRVGTLTFDAGENCVISGVIDPSHDFAYFGTDTMPGTIIKVKLSTLTREGGLTLNEGENSLGSAVIDSAGDWAYFGTWTAPGMVVKIKLSDFTRNSVLVLSDGESGLSTAVIDPASGFAYFGTDTNPGRVIKVNLETMSHVKSLIFNADESFLYSAVIDAAGFAYFGADTAPGKIIKVTLATLSREGALALNDGEDSLYSAIIDGNSGVAYFGTRTSPGIIIKIDLASLTRLDALNLSPAESYISAAVIDPSAGFAYFGTDTDPGIVVKVDMATMTRLGAITLNPGESYLYSAVIDPEHSYAYFGTYTDPGMVIRIDLATFSRESRMSLDTDESYLTSAVIDPDAGFAYFGTETDPGLIVKVNLGTFSRVGVLPLSSGESNLTSAVIDPTAHHAYFGTYTAPGTVVKVNLTSFTKTAVLPFATGENYLYSAAIDPIRGFALFGTWTAPGRVVRINLGTFEKAGSVTLDTGEEYLSAATLDPSNGYAYFATDTAPGLVVKVNGTVPSRLGSLTLTGGQDYISTALIDPICGYAYFGAYTSPGQIVRIDLGNTTTAISSSSNPAMLGEAVEFTAQVNPVVIGSGTPTGAVAFKSGGDVIVGCGNVILDGAAQARCTTSTLPLGTHIITAEYSGSGNTAWNPSTGTLAGGQSIVTTLFDLTIVKAGTGDGSVTSNPAGIDCGTTCSARYLPDTIVTLTAPAAADSNFAGFSGGGCSGLGPCQVTMDQARTVTATFNRLTTLGFYPLLPCRVFDTRNSSGAPPIAANDRRVFIVTGTCSVPTDAKAISANFTVVDATARGDLSVVGGHLTTTGVSTLSVPLGRARANNAAVQLSTAGDGTIAVFNSTAGTLNLILDVNGYFK